MLKEGYAEVNGIRLHYVRDGNGRPIIFQHGFGQSWRQWKNQFAEFSKDYEVVAVDMPGFADSDKPAEVEKYKMRNLAGYLTGLADQLGFNKISLVAHNLNGFGWIYAAFYPERLEKLVIINAPHPNVMNNEWKNNPEQARASNYVPKIQAPDGEKFLSDNNYAMIRDFMGIDQLRDRGTISKQDYDTIMDIISRPGTMTAWCNYYRASQTRGLEKDQPEKKMPSIMIYTPALVIWGMKDHALLPGLLNGLEEYVPVLTVKRVPEGTHQVVHEEPELINSHIREFLRA